MTKTPIPTPVRTLLSADPFSIVATQLLKAGFEQVDEMQLVYKLSKTEFIIFDKQVDYAPDGGAARTIQFTSIFFDRIDLNDYTADQLTAIIAPYGFTYERFINEQPDINQFVAEFIAETSSDRYTDEQILTYFPITRYINRYEDFGAFSRCMNVSKEDFEEALENNHYQDITLGTINATSDVFMPREMNEKSIIDAIEREMIDDVQSDLWPWEDDDDTEPLYNENDPQIQNIANYAAYHDFFIIEDRIYKNIL